MRFESEDDAPEGNDAPARRGAGLRHFLAIRPTSYYLLFAILVVVLLGSQVVHIREDPWRFGLFLALNFVFFLIVISIAISDMIGIIRDGFRERERTFSATIGDKEFVDDLRDRIDSRRGDS